MLDIALIREKPEWVKQQIMKVNDADAVARVDTIIELDKQRRSLLAESEAIQAGRNKLNKNVGRLRGDKAIDEPTRATRAVETVKLVDAGSYDGAAGMLAGDAPVTPDPTIDADVAIASLMNRLGELGAKVEDITNQLRGIEAALNE